MPLPMAMSGASGPSTAPKLRVTKAAMMMPGRLDRRNRAGRLESLRRLVPAGSGQIADRQADQQSARGKHRNRPPDRCRVEPEISGQRREEVLRCLGDTLQEEYATVGDRDAEDRAGARVTAT